MFRVVGAYIGAPDARFDLDYYLTRHSALARDLLGPHGLQHLRVLSGFEPSPGDAASLKVVSEMVFRSRDDFEAGMAAHGARLFDDLKNFTELTPLFQVCSRVDEL